MSILKDTFYKITSVIEKTEGFTRLGITLNPEHTVFKGHFPGNPMTPGACMVQIIKELVVDQLNKDVRITEARQIKFLNILVPNETAELEVQLEVDKIQTSEVSVKAKFFDKSNTYLKFSGKFIFDA